LVSEPALQDLHELLADFSGQLVGLEKVLREEQACIAQREPERLAEVLQEKIRLLQQTEAMDALRVAHLTAAGLDNDPDGMAALLDRQLNGQAGGQAGEGARPGFGPDAEDLATVWASVLDGLRRCQAVNEANGAVIRKGMSENKRLLDLLRGDDPEAVACYGMDGGKPPTTGGRDLGKA